MLLITVWHRSPSLTQIATARPPNSIRTTIDQRTTTNLDNFPTHHKQSKLALLTPTPKAWAWYSALRSFHWRNRKFTQQNQCTRKISAQTTPRSLQQTRHRQKTKIKTSRILAGYQQQNHRWWWNHTCGRLNLNSQKWAVSRGNSEVA